MLPRIATFLAALTVAVPAAAGNGLNMIGFGTESVLMAGADTAVARDTSSLNANLPGWRESTAAPSICIRQPHIRSTSAMPIASATTWQRRTR